ncbi:hypothetical protein L596_010145 [Steinernema carpocapsae]|uniref:Uncharacterized protein n=1 Tax=Steinernema carpocapsae TaxID=34508 RepID=A0A4U5PHG3_STECR|nr:hypothetical protein L596_010145 [Steinernema carpocapsae]
MRLFYLPSERRAGAVWPVLFLNYPRFEQRLPLASLSYTETGNDSQPSCTIREKNFQQQTATSCAYIRPIRNDLGELPLAFILPEVEETTVEATTGAKTSVATPQVKVEVIVEEKEENPGSSISETRNCDRSGRFCALHWCFRSSGHLGL